MIKAIKENPVLSAVLASGITIPMMMIGAAWAVDARIEQKTNAQIKQLRTDIVQDFEQNRIDYLQMKKQAEIIKTDERIELEYLKEKQK